MSHGISTCSILILNNNKNFLLKSILSHMQTAFFFLQVCYLLTLSVSRLCRVDDRMISKCGAVDGMRIGRGN
jgi:hypothetical protein